MSTSNVKWEIDVPRCSLTYGTAPCTAAIGTTGDKKCFNSPATCQDPDNFDEEIQTVRLVRNSTGIALDGSIPFLKSVTVDAQRIRPGENLGKRERATAKFVNKPHNDSLFDKYIADRDYNPWESGTFFGRFAARYPNIQGYPCRLIREYQNDDGTTDTETLYYFAEDGSVSQDLTGYTIAARDGLAFIEGDKTLCPRPSNGTIDRNLNDTTDDTLVLEPAGIGNEYNSLGEYSMGKEYGTFTRSGDTITLTARGILGSEVEEHDAGETFQQAAVFESENFPGIIYTLLNIFSETPLSYTAISVSQWEAEADAYNPRLYTGRVAEPTPVHKLISELMQDLGLNIYADAVRQRLVVKVIRPQASSAILTDDVLMAPLSRQTLTDKRISAAYIQYGRRNPLENMDEPSNYRGGIIRFNDDPNIALQGLTPSIKRHYSRWTPSTLRASASDTAALMVDRYGQAPQELQATIPREFSPGLASVVTVRSRVFEDDEGKIADIPMQVVKVDTGTGRNRITLEEYRVQARESEGVRLISLSSDEINMGQYDTMRDLHDSVWGIDPIPDNTEVIFDADPDVVFGSSSTGEFSVDMGGWPETANGVTIEVRSLSILGKGGNARTSTSEVNGQDGGDALLTTVAVTLTDCIIGGGGGGGGSAYAIVNGSPVFAEGGGGAGRIAGNGFEDGDDLTGGAGQQGATLQPSTAGDGGDIGQSGGNATSDGSGAAGVGGSPGNAIDGFSLITNNGSTIYGPTVN